MSRGVGFVRFDKRPEAENAINSLNNTIPLKCKDPITVKFANNPSQKQLQVAGVYGAAQSPARRLGAAGPVFHTARSYRYFFGFERLKAYTLLLMLIISSRIYIYVY